MSPDRDGEVSALVAAGQGDRRAFGDFYDLVAPSVYAMCSRLAGDSVRAEDATRRTLIDLWRLAPRFDPARHTVRAWCERAVRRQWGSAAVPATPQAVLDLTTVLGLDLRTVADELGLEPEETATMMTTALRGIGD